MNEQIKVPVPQASLLIVSKLLGWQRLLLTRALVWPCVNLHGRCRYLALPLII